MSDIASGDGPDPEKGGLTRRTFLAEGAGAIGTAALVRRLTGGRSLPRHPRLPVAHQSLTSDAEALRVLGRTTMRTAGSLPDPALPAGTDTLPEIEHVVVLMMENHSYDNFFGMLGRGIGQTPRGDGFTIANDGYPSASNPYANGTAQRAFRMPTTCQLSGKPSQEWAASHIQYANGRNNGFVISPSGPVAMGYWQQQDLPFTYDLATKFPIGDRWFCSLLGQTDPNRRYLIAATSSGMTDDINNSSQISTVRAVPPNGTIFTHLTKAGITWTDYYSTKLTGETMLLYPLVDIGFQSAHAKPIAQFFTDAKAGKLPSFSLIEPNYSTQSQEDPQNIVVGESFLASVVDAVGGSPAWRKTILIIVYDEHGGYFDHVPPPAALAPDSIGPVVPKGEQTYAGFSRYGFRVPSVIVGPYAKPGHVSHVVYDHTSILAFVERKWNLPALTRRDANANDLTDFLDLTAMAKGKPTFPELPKLAKAGENATTLACSTSGPGTIPPPPPKPIPITLTVKSLGIKRRLHGLELQLTTDFGTLTGLRVELLRSGQLLKTVSVPSVSTAPTDVILRINGGPPKAGHYAVVVKQAGKALARTAITVG